MSETTEPNVGTFTLADPLTTEPTHPVEVPEHEDWQLPNGFAWVFPGEGNRGLVRPVIMADGFNLGRSELDKLYQGLEGDYPFITELRRRGRDVILLGFEERSASILDNARAAEAAIMRAIAEQVGDARLVVGGFSMGGIVTRYALARMERQRMDHRTALYFSYDSPHRGASIPVGVQTFSHFIPFPNAFAKQMDSPAARQMLWRHYDKETGKVGVAPERTEFLDALGRVGSWPQIPVKVAVANGRADGVGLPDVKPGDVALRIDRIYPGTTFYTQAQGDDVTVAYLNRRFPKAEKTVTTNGFPEVDGAPGGTLHTYKILADAMRKLGGTVDLRHEKVCFVPSVSAVAIRDVETQEDLYTPISGLVAEESELDDFFCSPTTTEHTAITAELCTWLMNRLPD
ncbi:alpha/beta hydrolase [Streptomyces phaeoluteigriseus]|uniref:Alpha/beta hydrolase n=1 Tax=Streptomyces phaeoluteigriseus TaxID=114686 RepID=A0ABY4ZH74_9ACTN|nr:alpha/beta hydrolase [Streptomyces phaeoluteigriseus]USQ88448.1 alpha/beta hydrolase [Streptomyces phaeoluteigriseus]